MQNVMQLLFVLLTLQLPAHQACGSDSAPATKTPLDVALGKAYGFVKGQRLAFDYIEKKYPKLAPRVKIARFEFAGAFGEAEKNIALELQRLIKEKMAELDAFLEKELAGQARSQITDKAAAEEFLNAAAERSKGESLPIEILQTLLIYEHRNNPSEEFSKGFTDTFTSKEHPKAKGLAFKIDYPLSWFPKEGERPNVVQAFTSESGRGLETIIVMVKNIPEGFTSEEVAESFTPEGLKEFLPAGTECISAKQVTLESQKAGLIIYRQTAERLDISVSIQTSQLITVFRDKVLFIQCSVSVISGKGGDISERYQLFEPLFKMVMNSLVLTDK